LQHNGALLQWFLTFTNTPNRYAEVGGERFGQDLKKFRKIFLVCLDKLLKQNHRPAKLSYSFSSQWCENSGELEIPTKNQRFI